MERCQKSAVLVIVFGLLLALATSAAAVEGGKVNINTASVEELAQLNQVGAITAQRIVEYRKTNGLFKTPEDLMNVKGIGEKIFTKNKNRISI